MEKAIQTARELLASNLGVDIKFLPLDKAACFSGFAPVAGVGRAQWGLVKDMVASFPLTHYNRNYSVYGILENGEIEPPLEKTVSYARFKHALVYVAVEQYI